MGQLAEMVAQPALRAVGILLGAVAAGWLVEIVLRRTLLALTRRTRTDLDDLVVMALRTPVQMSVVLLGVVWALRSVEVEAGVRQVGHSVLVSIGVAVWGHASIRIGGIVLSHLSRTAKETSVIQPRTEPIFDILLKLGVIGVSLYFVFVAWRIDLTAWLASAGIVGIAVGFAAKDTLANLFAGIFILADAPYRLGDMVVLDGGLRGRVTSIGIRSTRLMTRDDVEVTVPNAMIGSSKVVNETGGPNPKSRIRASVSVAYGSDIQAVRQVLGGCPEGIDDICPDPQPIVRFREMADSGLRFELLVWIEDPTQRGRIIDELNTRIYDRLRAAQIEIPYPKQDVYVRAMPPTT